MRVLQTMMAPLVLGLSVFSFASMAHAGSCEITNRIDSCKVREKARGGDAIYLEYRTATPLLAKIQLYRINQGEFSNPLIYSTTSEVSFQKNFFPISKHKESKIMCSLKKLSENTEVTDTVLECFGFPVD